MSEAVLELVEAIKAIPHRVGVYDAVGDPLWHAAHGVYPHPTAGHYKPEGDRLYKALRTLIEADDTHISREEASDLISWVAEQYEQLVQMLEADLLILAQAYAPIDWPAFSQRVLAGERMSLETLQDDWGGEARAREVVKRVLDQERDRATNL